MLLSLGACGGGSDAPPAETPPAAGNAVTDITAGPLSYGKAAKFTITGQALDTNNISVSVSRCTGLSLLAGGTAQVRTITCRVTGTGPLQMDAKDPQGNVLLSRTFTVPEPQVRLQTSLGTILLELNPTASPLSVNNYLAYVNSGFYAGTLFHRVVPGFVVQGGGFTSGLGYKTPTFDPIALETPNGLSHARGTLGMARTNIANSATTQFFFNLQDNPGLNYVSSTAPGYVVFGRIKEGLDVMDAMAAVTTITTSSLSNLPQSDITILSATQTQ